MKITIDIVPEELKNTLVMNKSAKEHPFLIVKKGDYALLRKRAARSPWKEMKASALHDAQGIDYAPTRDVHRSAMLVKNVVSSCALAYILNPDKKTFYCEKIFKSLLSGWDEIGSLTQAEYDYARDTWPYNVPVGSAFFNSVLALDIIQKDLSKDQLRTLEKRLEKVAEWFRTKASRTAWFPFREGALGIWELYNGNMKEVKALTKRYREGLLEQLTEDGVFLGGGLYAFARFGGIANRDSKIHFLDVLEFTGVDTGYYQEPKLQKFYEWLFGHSVTATGRLLAFGDTQPEVCFTESGSAMCRAHRFSQKAAKYAAWLNSGRPFPGRLLFYVLTDKPLPAPGPPSSQILKNGIVDFRERSLSKEALLGAMLNSGINNGSHAHFETNAVYLFAYGKPVLINGGYATFAGNGAYGYDRRYLGSALAGNTVMINVLAHESILGGGITEGFTCEGFDYASGSSGPALADGHHQRNFCMVHPREGTLGYFILFDEVTTKKAADVVHLVLHPYADNMKTILENSQYDAKIGPFDPPGDDVHLMIFFGTEPDVVQVRRGVVNPPKVFVGGFLHSRYTGFSRKRGNMVTLLVPYDRDHSKPESTRLGGEGYSGALLSFGKTVADVALGSSGAKRVKHEKIEFQGQACVYRLQGNRMQFYFLRRGRLFYSGERPRQGYESGKAISLFLEGRLGRIVSPGTKVKFYCPAIRGALLDQEKAKLINKGEDWVQVHVPAGSYELELLATPPAPDTPLHLKN